MTKNSIHAHIRSDSADCDGRYSSSHVRLPSDGQTDSDFMAELRALHGVRDAEVENLHYGFAVYDITEEGYSNFDVQFCHDYECANEKSTYRDYRAESMGY